MMRTAAALSSLLFVLAAGAQITPEVTCWRDDASDLTTIVFGYTNAGTATTIARGAANFVMPPPDGQSQPESFASGSVANAFTMSIAAADASAASWTVEGNVVYFNRALVLQCAATMCLCPAGPEGTAGAVGEAGPEGAQGAAGATGDAGAQGNAGATGPPGAPGPAGDAGGSGAIGPEGPRGPTGGTGPAGSVGERGPVGAQGPQGPRGGSGDPGEAGPSGGAGPRGAMGEAGPQGAAGARGSRGIDGAAGIDGLWAIRDSASAETMARVTADDPSSLLVMATVSARAETSGSLQIVVDGVPRGPSFAVASRATTIPLVTAIPVSGGEHVVRIVSADAEILASSLSVFVSEGETPTSGKRRGVRH
jgi:hypothetical protein